MPNEAFYRKKTRTFFEEMGGTVDQVSCFNHRTKRSRDLFGIFDLVVVGVDPWPTLYVQFTSGSNHATRRRKIAQNGALKAVLSAGNGVALVSWRKRARDRFYSPRVELFGLKDVE